VRCFSCGKVIGDKWNAYLELLAKDMSEGSVRFPRRRSKAHSLTLLSPGMHSMNFNSKDIVADAWFSPMWTSLRSSCIIIVRVQADVHLLLYLKNNSDSYGKNKGAKPIRTVGMYSCKLRRLWYNCRGHKDFSSTHCYFWHPTTSAFRVPYIYSRLQRLLASRYHHHIQQHGLWAEGNKLD